MNRKLIFAGVVAAVTMATPAKAQVMIEMSEITCKQFSEYDPETEAFISNWMRGYFSAKKNLSVVELRKLDTDLPIYSQIKCIRQRPEPTP